MGPSRRRKSEASYTSRLPTPPDTYRPAFFTPGGLTGRQAILLAKKISLPRPKPRPKKPEPTGLTSREIDQDTEAMGLKRWPTEAVETALESPHIKMKRLQQYIRIEKDRLVIAEIGTARFRMFVQCVVAHELQRLLERRKGMSVRQEPLEEIRNYNQDLKIAELERELRWARKALAEQKKKIENLVMSVEDGAPRLDISVKVEQRVDTPFKPQQRTQAWLFDDIQADVLLMVRDADDMLGR